MNRLLLRQINRSLGGMDKIPADIFPLIAAISRSYDHYEEDRELLHRSIDISSTELFEANEQQSKALDSLKSLVLDIERDNKKVNSKSLSLSELVETTRGLVEKIIATEKELTEKNAELEQFAYIVSHDLKAPLRSIGSLTDWIHKDYEHQLDDQGKDYMRLLKLRVVRMDELINGILRYARIGMDNSEHSSYDLNILVQDVINLIGEESDVKIEISNQLPVCLGNETQLKQVFQNLISNGIKYNHKSKKRISISYEGEKNGMHLLSVQDNGMGIEEKYEDKIFQIFQTLKNKKDNDGTGIGLTIVKKIIDQMGGEIYLE
ncbi:MAG: ATP-binding protein, partial [Bacteroidota bacterium]